MMSRGWTAGLAAGLLLNVLGWIGNQLVLGRMWRTTVSTVTPLRQRTLFNELLSLVPDFVYGIALAWLFLVLVSAGRDRRTAAWQAALLVWAVGAMTTYLGVWNSGLVPGGLAVATTLLALVTFVPTSWVVARLLKMPAPAAVTR
ncbi:MAG TPA: hypothetical protein VK922_03380 [Gemmatimonadaceae bacterium]|nr:hypothetical protein [Gemmatimonadaceae bacterium]